MERGLARPALLIEQGRYDMAERELRGRLAEQPDDAVAHSLLAFCLSHRERHAEAEKEARAAVGLAPDLAFSHYHLAVVLERRDSLTEAVRAIQDAIRLDTEDADYHAFLASIRVQQSRWSDALAAVDQALALDPDHSDATNLRALILTQTGRADQAHEMLDTALAREPDSALSHANRGWTLLRQGRHPEALDHFREALRLDPEMEYARGGIVEAMKARNPLYRPLLRFFLWMSGLEGRTQMFLVLGAFFGFRILSSISRQNPGLAPFITPVIWAYTGFVLLTWIAEPLFNLFLRLDRFGRHALSRGQIVASNWLGGVLGIALVALGAGFATGSSTAYLVAIAAFALALPIGGASRLTKGWPRRILIGYTALLGLLLLLGILVHTDSVQKGDLQEAVSSFGGVTRIAIMGGAISTWIALAFSAIRLRR
jgi:tetratricopeptide (TPR) repeat protein